ncbi:hypothetical protein ACIBF1_20945 [Spirillospora sp. NPDC050679]
MEDTVKEEAPRRSRWRIGAPLLLAAGAIAAVAVVQTTSAQAQPAALTPVAAERNAPLTAGGVQATDYEDEAEAFTACMRSNDVKDFPGVTITKDGQVQLKSGARINPFDATYRAAAKTCAHHLPKGSPLPGDPKPPNPSAPPLNFECTSGCPTPPAAPKLTF